jgi:hypothetical protein
MVPDVHGQLLEGVQDELDSWLDNYYNINICAGLRILAPIRLEFLEKFARVKSCPVQPLASQLLSPLGPQGITILETRGPPPAGVTETSIFAAQAVFRPKFLTNYPT